MSRLIDADELERAVMSLGEDVVCDDCAYEFVNLIDAQPTIEALEKRDEPKMVEVDRRMDSGMHLAHCPNCWKFINNIHHNKYCGYCGQAVKWE